MRLFVTGLLALILSSGCFVSQHVEASLEDDLIQAAECGDKAKASKPLKRGAKVNHANKYGETALTFAAEYGHTNSKLLQMVRM